MDKEKLKELGIHYVSIGIFTDNNSDLPKISVTFTKKDTNLEDPRYRRIYVYKFSEIMEALEKAVK